MADKHDHENCSHAHEADEILKKIKELPLKDRVKAVAIYHYTQKKAQLDDELEKKIKSLQKESDLLALPIYDKQSQLITGQRAPTAEELKDLDQYFTDAESQQKDEFRANSEPLEGFWGKVIENCDEIKQRFNPEGANEQDAQVLKFLTRIQAELATDSDNFTLRFTFKENEHFTNTELTKTFHFKEPKAKDVAAKDAHDHHHHDEAEEDFPFKTVGTEIKWNAGKDITKKTIQKKQKNKKSGASRTVNKVVDAESFFNFFRSINFEDKDQLEDEQADEQDAKMEDDYETGRTILDEVIPFSLEYFLGINPENEDEDYDDVDDDDKEGDDDEDKEEDNDTDEDDGKKKGKKAEKSNRKKSGDSNKDKKDKDSKPKDGGKEQEKVDCKQQ